MSDANSRILKNTVLLYVRLIFLTLINLYAVRITLNALGVVDYGIFTVIASVVASLSILTGAMTSATQRFLSFHLGKGDYHKYSHTFTLLLMSFIAIAIILILIGEIIGWLMIDKWLTIPADRVSAAYWVYQASLLGFAFGFVTIPYTSSIIANERMDAFALFSIVEGVLKLGIAYWLLVYGGDRLILYGWLTACVSLVVLLMSMQYCHSKFRYCKYVWKWDRSVFSELSKYTGWNLFGSVSGILASQGQNILLNIFFGPVVNTSKGIADRIQNVINGFSVNLYMAVSPQIIKSYASEDYTRALNLVLKTSKMSFLLIFVLSFPLICSMDSVLELWLGADSKTPDMTSFSKLILIYCMTLSLEPPISRIIQATGNIKRYQLYVGAITLLYIPIAAIILSFGGDAVLTLVILIAITVIAQIVRVVVAHNQVNLDYSQYLKIVVYPILRVILISVPVYWAVESSKIHAGLMEIILHLLLTGVMGLFIAALFGISVEEHQLLWDALLKKIQGGDRG